MLYEFFSRNVGSIFSICFSVYKELFKLKFKFSIICRFRANFPLMSRGLASVGDLVNQMYRIKNQLPNTKLTWQKPKTPIAPNRCYPTFFDQFVRLFNSTKVTFYNYFFSVFSIISELNRWFNFNLVPSFLFTCCTWNNVS